MRFDPTLPANNSPIVSAELRNQFNALKALIDDLQTQITVLQLPDQNIVLSYDASGDELSWTFDGPAPAQWEIVNSTDGGLTYPNQEFIAGSATGESPAFDTGQWKMRQANPDNSPASAWSNTAIHG